MKQVLQEHSNNGCLSLLIFGRGLRADEKKKDMVVKYKKYTQIDLTGQTIEGKVRSPSIFYIFQRKRSLGHRVLSPPLSFNKNYAETLDALERQLPKERP